MAYPVNASVRFPTRPTAKANLIGVEVLQREYAHEVCALNLRNTPTANATFREGTPVEVQWGFYPRNYAKFVGYVLHAKPKEDREKRTSLAQVVCIGATYYFKDSNQRMFLHHRGETVVAAIAADAHFDAVYDDSATVWPMLASPGLTDWQFLVKVAKQRGATLIARNTALYCYDPVKYLLDQIDGWPVIKFTDTDGGPVHIARSEAVIGSGETTQPFRIHDVTFIDPTTKAVVHATENLSREHLADVQYLPTFTQHVHTPATSQSLAQAEANALGLQHRFNQKLKTRIPGRPKMVAGGGVVLSGYDNETDGLWFVSEVRHEVNTEVHPATYWTNLVLLRDSRSKTGAPAQPPRAVRRTTSNSPRLNAPVLVGDRYQSPRQETYVLRYGKLAA